MAITSVWSACTNNNSTLSTTSGATWAYLFPHSASDPIASVASGDLVIWHGFAESGYPSAVQAGGTLPVVQCYNGSYAPGSGTTELLGAWDDGGTTMPTFALSHVVGAEGSSTQVPVLAFADFAVNKYKQYGVLVRGETGAYTVDTAVARVVNPGGGQLSAGTQITLDAPLDMQDGDRLVVTVNMYRAAGSPGRLPSTYVASADVTVSSNAGHTFGGGVNKYMANNQAATYPRMYEAGVWNTGTAVFPVTGGTGDGTLTFTLNNGTGGSGVGVEYAQIVVTRVRDGAAPAGPVHRSNAFDVVEGTDSLTITVDTADDAEAARAIWHLSRSGVEMTNTDTSEVLSPWAPMRDVTKSMGV